MVPPYNGNNDYDKVRFSFWEPWCWDWSEDTFQNKTLETYDWTNSEHNWTNSIDTYDTVTFGYWLSTIASPRVIYATCPYPISPK